MIGTKKIFSYIKELSIVMIGVLATLAITDKISRNSKQREIQESLQFIKIELKENLQNLNKAKINHENEMQMFKLIRENIDNITNVSADTLLKYFYTIGGGITFTPVKDAYDVFKSSGLMQNVKDKDILLELAQTYSLLDKSSTKLKDYSSQKWNSTREFMEGMSMDEIAYFIEEKEKGNPYAYYNLVLTNEKIKAFLYRGEEIVEYSYLLDTQNKIQEIVKKIDTQKKS